MFHDYAKLFILALATSSISLTLSKAKIFKGLREFVAQRSAFLGKLISCPYCTSHWIAIWLVCLYAPLHRPVQLIFILNWFVISMAIVAMAAILMGLIFQAISSISEE